MFGISSFILTERDTISSVAFNKSIFEAIVLFAYENLTVFFSFPKSCNCLIYISKNVTLGSPETGLFTFVVFHRVYS